MLEIRNLHARVEDKEILKGLDLTVQAGEVHSIMGPNGSGKSTLAQVLAGRDTYEVTEGQVTYEGKGEAPLPSLRRVRRLAPPRRRLRPKRPWRRPTDLPRLPLLPPLMLLRRLTRPPLPRLSPRRV